MSYGAQAYARTSQTTVTPRDIEAQPLLKAGEVQSNWMGPDNSLHKALMFNRRLWCIFFAAAGSMRIRARSKSVNGSPISRHSFLYEYSKCR